MDGPLLVVDVQQCFLNEFTRHIPARIARLAARDAPEPVLFTRFVNVADGPCRRFLDWHDCAEAPGTDLAPEVAELARPDRVFAKPGYAGVPDELAAYLIEHRVECVSIVGIDTDMCVLKVALDVFDLGIEPLILVDCCASTGGLQSHLAGLTACGMPGSAAGTWPRPAERLAARHHIAMSPVACGVHKGSLASLLMSVVAKEGHDDDRSVAGSYRGRRR